VNLPVVTLRPGHIQPVHAGHPWIYAQAIARVQGGALTGDEVAVVDPRGTFLGRGFYSPKSAIPIRILSRDRETPLDGAFFRERILRARALRHAVGLPSEQTTGYRLIHSEGDDLPGLIVDVFGDVCAVQFTTAGMKRREGLVLTALEEALAPRAIWDRTSREVAKTEEFAPTGGTLRGDESVKTLHFRERGLSFELPQEISQKTGFYFDQRPLRARVEELAQARRVLDCYSFVGTFALGAARGGATEVVAVDESAIALTVGASVAAREPWGKRITFQREDARKTLKDAARDPYDLVVCDPPKLVPRRAAKEDGLAAYRKLYADAVRATKPWGLLVACSCSGLVRMEDVVRALALGARDADRRAVVIERHVQGPDHPVPAAFPEGLYLTSVIARIEPR
jgi:23S rRNA (cytosine1962-C5)-methyltransferase